MNSDRDEQLLQAISDLTVEIHRLANQQRSWKIALRNGLMAGLGGVLGATVLVSILVYTLQPFRKLEGLGPVIERLDRTLKQTRN